MRFTADELAALFHEAGFPQATVRGMVLLPGQVSRRLPVSWVGVESWLSRMPASHRLGSFLIGVGRV
jgi:hypothetical protein